MYNYDRGGNILSKVKYAYTTGTLGTAQQTISYTYGDSNWKDKLTAYNGKAITYDAIGNPLSDGTWTYTWQAGRQLKQMSKTGTTIRYEYNHDGLRTPKFVDTSNKTDATYYTYNGKNIIHVIKNSDHLHIFYDAQNRPAKVSHNGIFYTYLYNLQGDVVGLVDKDGTLVVEYKYDAWGKPISTTGTMADTLGKLNPFRYRGYIYDDQTGLYYLRSRYYQPNVCRFLSRDSILTSYHPTGANLFAYCINRPAQFVDEDGNVPTPVAIVTPSPSRPDGWDAAYRRQQSFEEMAAHARNLWKRIAKTYEQRMYKTIAKDYVKYSDHRKEGGSVHIGLEYEKVLHDFKISTLNKTMINEISSLISCKLKNDYNIQLTEIGEFRLRGEIRFHVVAYDRFGMDNCAVIDIDAYSDGSLYDSRPLVNLFTDLFGYSN